MSKFKTFKKLELLRKNVLNSEIYLIVYKYIYKQLIKYISTKLNILCIDLKFLKNLVYMIFKLKYIININTNYLTKYKRFCVISKHSRSLQYFRLSRMSLKDLITRGNILGLYKAS
jgi:ribosomal protein S14